MIWLKTKSTNKAQNNRTRLVYSNVSHPPNLCSRIGSIDLDVDEVDNEGSSCCDKVGEVEEGVESCEGREGGDEEVVV